MLTLVNKSTAEVKAKSVYFSDNTLHVFLSDGREISMSIDKIEWLNWLNKATPEQRRNWSIEPGGFAIYWEDLDDGLEICHLLGMQVLA